MSHHRIIEWLRRMLGRAAPKADAAPLATPTLALSPLILPVWAAWADAVTNPLAKPIHRPLAAQLASQALLNRPSCRKLSISGPKQSAIAKPKPRRVEVTKSLPTARSVFLQARHLAIKPARRPSNVVVLSVSVPRKTVQRAPRLAA